MHALQYRGDTLEAHARINARARQRRHGAVGAALELHKHQIPYLDVAIAVFLRRARGATPHLGAVVVENLRAGSARARVPHGPEVVLIAHARDAIRGHADLVAPDLLRLVVAVVDRDPELFRREAKALRQQRPGKANRIVLEVIAEGEIPQHFEEGVVTCGVTDVLEIVVLTPGPHAALAGDRALIAPLLPPREHVLELHHARVSKQQGGVVPGHEGAARHDLMAVLLKELKEGAANVRAFHSDSSAWGSAMQRGRRCPGSRAVYAMPWAPGNAGSPL